MRTGFLADLFRTVQFREFTETDWYGFAGCETEKPLIGEASDGIYIIDGDIIQFFSFDEESDVKTWELTPIY